MCSNFSHFFLTVQVVCSVVCQQQVVAFIRTVSYPITYILPGAWLVSTNLGRKASLLKSIEDLNLLFVVVLTQNRSSKKERHTKKDNKKIFWMFFLGFIFVFYIKSFLDQNLLNFVGGKCFLHIHSLFGIDRFQLNCRPNCRMQWISMVRMLDLKFQI